MSGPERCQRCPRPATHAVGAETFTLRLCRHHAEQLVDALAVEPTVTVGRRTLRLAPPMLDARTGVRRC